MERIRRGTEVNRPERGFVFIMLKPLGCEPKTREKLLEGISQLGHIELHKKLVITKELIEQHYESVKYNKEGKLHKYYYPITSYLTGKKTEAMVVRDVLGINPETFVTEIRSLIGPSNPLKTKEGQLRNLAIKQAVPFQRVVNLPKELQEVSNKYCLDNLIHCSDSLEAATREVGIWFPEEVHAYQQSYERINHV